MARLRYAQQWFNQLSLGVMPEGDFESLVLQNSEMIQADAWAIPFKKTIYAQERNAKADLAFIDHQYKEWFVVEVEMRRHDLYGHVLPQVRTLRDGTYGRDESDYLLERNPHLDPTLTADLVRGTSPRIVVIADRIDVGWRDVLRGADVELITLEVYKSALNAYIFSVDGSLPQRAKDLVSLCHYNQMLPRHLRVESPASLGIAPNQRIDVLWDGQLTEWVRMDLKDSCFLRTRASVELKVGIKYALLRSEDGSLTMRPVGIGGLPQ